MRLNAQRGEMMEHMGGMGERFMMMHRPDGGPDDGAPPPPPPPSN
jgi:hypothetical protein